jgi:hypothetical protein
MNFIRTNWLGLIVIFLFVWLMFKPSGCGPKAPWERNGNDTIRSETRVEYIPQPPVYIPQYIPVETSTSYPVVIPADRQASTDLAALTKQYNALLKDHLAVRNYKDSIQLKDSSGNRVGIVNLNDNVFENRLGPRNVDYTLNLPHTTTTITLREPPSRQMFIGGGLTGNTKAPVNGVNLGLMYKNKKDRLFGASAGFQEYNGQFVPQFQISTYWKIKL